MKYRIILYLFLLGIAVAVYFIELESIYYLASRGLFWFLVIFLTSFISTLFKLILFIGKKVSFLSLLMLSVAEIMGMVLLVGSLFLLIFIYIGAILAFYTLVDESSATFSKIFTSFIFNFILFINIFIELAHVFHIHITIVI
jgi:hypothetical protein